MTHISFFYDDDVTLLRENMSAQIKKTEALLDSRTEVGLDVNAEEKSCLCVCVWSPDCRIT
jgi:hypothetical protein